MFGRGGGRSKVPCMIMEATHHLQICTIFGCIVGNKMSADGIGWMAIMVAANSNRGSHSFECGW